MTLRGRRIVSLMISVALHGGVLTVLLLVPMAGRSGSPTGDRVTVAVLSFPEPGKPTAADAITEGQKLADSVTDPHALRIPGFEVDVAKVRERQDALFPFLTEDLAAVDAVRDTVAARAPTLTWPTPSLPRRSRSGLPPLRLSDAELWHLVDEAWSRRERWQTFVKIATLVTEHDPDEGRAPELLRLHLDQNLLQPYYDAETRDPRFWVMLNLAADHAPILRFVTRFVQEHPSSHSSTELLFLLDEFAQASRDALLMLMATEPERDLRLTREADPSAYALAVAVRERYRTWLRERNLDTTDAIRDQYDAIRLRILMTIIETTPAGYGAADARFLVGRILWAQNNVPDALRWWRDITPDDRGMYAPIYTEVLDVVQSTSTGKAARISALLGSDYRQWLEFSARRLAEFGYRLDTF
jgi:hypothetical protein